MAMNPVTITLNGNPYEISETATLATMLGSLGLAGKPVVIELNEQAVFPREYETTTIPSGARVEVVTLAAGG
jgi:sulfur carrier protein